MKLVTWNCCRGPFEQKVRLLDALGADIAVLQECAQPPDESETCLWFGDNPRQGIAVVARAPYAVRRLAPLQHVPKFVFPLAVNGPLDFNMLAVWSKAGQAHNYVEGVVKAIQMYRELLTASPAVLIGDLNSNQIWDKTHPADRNHTALVAELGRLDMISAYHAYYGEAHGEESRATYFFRWSEQRPYHIDYCFIPSAWARDLAKVDVAGYEDWKRASDHRPLLVELTFQGAKHIDASQR